MRVIRVAAMLALLNGPALAQHMQEAGQPDKDKTPGQLQSEKRAEDAYERSLGNIPDKGTTDPWGAVRNNDGPKATGKAASAKRRTTK